MAEARRRLVRLTPAPEARSPEPSLRLQKLRRGLEKERAAFARWLVRLKRAFHAVEKQLRRIARIERQLTKQEGT
jgi:hypothetical protein